MTKDALEAGGGVDVVGEAGVGVRLGETRLESGRDQRRPSRAEPGRDGGAAHPLTQNNPWIDLLENLASLDVLSTDEPVSFDSLGSVEEDDLLSEAVVEDTGGVSS